MSSRGRTSSSYLTLAAVLLAGVLAVSQQTKTNAGSRPSSVLAKARVQLSKHDLKSAEDSLWSVLNSDPNNSEALLLLGLVRGEQQRYPEAEALFQRAGQLNPRSAPVRVYLGKIYLTENKLPEATEQYKQARELDPQNVEVKVTLARLFAAAGQFSDALATLDAIPSARYPVEGIPVKIGCLLALDRKDEATKLVAQVKDPALDIAIAEIFVTSKMPKQALQSLTKAAAAGRRPPARFYFVKAKALDVAGNWMAAMENFQKALALEPNSEEFLLAAAELYARQEKHTEAFELLQRAYKLDHESLSVLRPLILEASFAGKSDQVQDAAEQLEAKSDEPQDLFVAASVMLKNRRQDEAVPLLEKYLEKVPGDPRAWVGLGVGYEDEKRFADAQKAFEHALEADPKFADAEYQLGTLVSLNGNSAVAMEHFERAVQMNPNHSLALGKLGNLYLQSGQFEKAREALLKAESVDPNNRETEYGLALAYSKLGNREEAKIHMDRFQKGSEPSEKK
jgi:tetratricopeptide (TPR) repeat protein